MALLNLDCIKNPVLEELGIIARYRYDVALKEREM